jgi:benzoyl-CoA-dihydrodiol lyase
MQMRTVNTVNIVQGVNVAAERRRLANRKDFIDFQTEPSRYRHWRLSVEGEVATLAMDVDENAGLFEGYQLKLNSYDLGVDIELADALMRLRFEHPNVKVVLLRSAKERVFSAGANIRMLAASEHAHKVNFCKFTNETRNAMEDASEHSGQSFIAVVDGTAAGGGYELALATDRIIMIDDGSTAVSLPEVPLLAVLPGTGGLTRVVDKRMVRRDHTDFFCTIEEGVKGKRAVQWRLIDELVSPSKLENHVKVAAAETAAKSPRRGAAKGVTLTALERKFRADGVDYGYVRLDVDTTHRTGCHSSCSRFSPIVTARCSSKAWRNPASRARPRKSSASLPRNKSANWGAVAAIAQRALPVADLGQRQGACGPSTPDIGHRGRGLLL